MRKWLDRNGELILALFFLLGAVVRFVESKEVRQAVMFVCSVYCAQSFLRDWLRKRWPKTWK